jgi:hypothetical protein
MCRYTQHCLLTREERESEVQRKLRSSASAIADVVLAIVLGAGIAALLVKWWCS